MMAAPEKDVARPDVAVKMDREVVRVAKMVASARGIPLAQYLSEVVGPIAKRDLEEETRKALGGPGNPESSRRKPRGGTP
jgi:hypothetical protein